MLAKIKNQNLLELAINAAEQRATLGEISAALEKVLEDILQKIKLYQEYTKWR